MSLPLNDKLSGGIKLPNITGSTAPIDGTYVTITTNPSLPNERVLSVDAAELTLTDGGPGGLVSLGLATTAVVPGAYTSANITVDSFGRITAASSGSGGQIRSFTYIPSGVADPANGVYTSWSDLYTEIVSQPSPVVVQFVSSGFIGAPVQIPAGVWDFTACPTLLFVGSVLPPNSLNPYCEVILDIGASILGWSNLTLRSIQLASSGAGGSIVLGNGCKLFLEASLLSAPGGDPCVTSATTTGEIVLNDDAVIALGAGPVVQANAGTSVQVRNLAGTVENDTFGGTGSGTLYQGAYLRYTGSVQGDLQPSITAWSFQLQSYADIHGYQPTTAGDWPVVPTTVQEGLDFLAAAGSPTLGYYMPEAPPSSPNLLDDEFNDPLLPGWTTWNPGGLLAFSASASESQLALTANAQSSGATFRLSGIYKSTPVATDWSVWAKVSITGLPPITGLENYGGGLFVAGAAIDGSPATSPLLTATLGIRGVNAGSLIYIQRWTNYQTFAANVVASELLARLTYVWFRYRWDNATTTLFFDYSTDGRSWSQLGSSTAAALGFTPARAGFHILASVSAVSPENPFLYADFIRFGSSASRNVITPGRVI